MLEITGTVYGGRSCARKAGRAGGAKYTHSPFINPLAGALSIAADGIWEPSYRGYNVYAFASLAWRAYVADRWDGTIVQKHFSSYALSQ